MKNKTIVILSQVNFDNSPYTSYTHYHAVELVNLGYKVIVLASVTIKPGVDLNKYTGVLMLFTLEGLVFLIFCIRVRLILMLLVIIWVVVR